MAIHKPLGRSLRFALFTSLVVVGLTVPIQESDAFQYWCAPKTIGAPTWRYYNISWPSSVNHWMQTSVGTAEETDSSTGDIYAYRVGIEVHYWNHTNPNAQPHGRTNLFVSTNYYQECRGGGPTLPDYSRKSNCGADEWWGVFWEPSYGLNWAPAVPPYSGTANGDLIVTVSYVQKDPPFVQTPSQAIINAQIAKIEQRTAAIFSAANPQPTGFSFGVSPIGSGLPTHYQHLNICDISENFGSAGECECTYSNAECV